MTTNSTIALCILAVPALLLAYFTLEMWLKSRKFRTHEIKLEQVTRSDYVHTATSYGILLLFVGAAMLTLVL